MRRLLALCANGSMAICLAGCIWPGSTVNEPQGFSSTHFRYQMQARQQAAKAQQQRALAEQSGDGGYQICEEPSWLDRMQARLQ